MKKTSALERVRILILEDNPADARLAFLNLEDAGLLFDGEVATNSGEFMALVGSNVYDLILSDYRLGVWTGLDALKWLRATDKHTPFILVSGTIGEERAVDCIKEGATDYVLKESLQRLPIAVRRALEDTKSRLAQFQAEAHAQESQDQMQLLLDSTTEGILGINSEGLCTFVNSACARLLTIDSTNSLIGKNVHELMHHTKRDGSPYPEPECPIYSGLREGASRHVDDEIFWRADGTSFPVEYWSHPIKNGEQRTGSVITFFDATERRALEQQLRQAQKLEAVGRLAGGVAHDFNNLLTIIVSSANLLEASAGTSDPVKEFSGMIRTATEKGATLTRQLLAFSRGLTLQPTILDLNLVAKEIGNMLPRLMGENIRMVVSLDPTLGRINADRGQIEQVLMNLAVNARDALPQGGELKIETSNVSLDCNAFAIHGIDLPAGQYVMLSVSDTGIGMDSQTQARIFEPFFTTKGANQGTGLGLATIYGIVKQSGGVVRVESKPGKGSTFQVYLPYLDAPVAAALLPAAPETAASGGTETILLVEDQAALRLLTSVYARSRGYTVIEAATGSEALDICANRPAPIHLLITDVALPGISGFVLAQAALENRPQLRVIYVSGYSEQSVDKHLLSPGSIYLEKPFSLFELGFAIRTMLDSGPIEIKKIA